MRRYAINANITFMMDAENLEDAMASAQNNLPYNAVILSLQAWPADIGCNADVGDISLEQKRLQRKISQLEKERNER